MTKKLLFVFIHLTFYNVIVSQNDTNRINELNKLAWELRVSNLDTAILLGNQSLTLLTQISENKIHTNNWKEKTLSRTYYYLGIFHNNKGNKVVAFDFISKALKISNDVNDTHGIAQAHGGLGLFYTTQGNLPKALENSMKALQIYEKINYKEGIAVQLSNIGNIYSAEGNHEKSLEFYSRALKILEQLNNKNRIAIQLGNIGNVYFYENNMAMAIEYYSKALAINREMVNKQGISTDLNNIASIYLQNKNFLKAIQNFEEALMLAKEIGDQDLILSAYGNIGIVYTNTKNYIQAENYLLKAIELSEKIKSIEAIQEFEGALSELYTQIGKDKLALIHYKKHINAKDSLFNRANTEKNVRLEMNSEFDKKQTIEKAKHEKEIIAFEAKTKNQKQLRVFLLIIIALILIILFFVKRAYDNKERVANFLAIEAQRKEILLQEVHHRINNNLQIISSLLTLQANSVKDDRLNEYLQQSQNRIQSLSTLHELLNQNDSLLEVNMKEYLEKIIDFHREILKTKSKNIAINLHINSINFQSKIAVPIALIVNELVTNSIKHAFSALNEGCIDISLSSNPKELNNWILNVKDNGKGLPNESEMRKDSLGLRLVNIMTKQMGATLEKNNSSGASFSFSFTLIN